MADLRSIAEDLYGRPLSEFVAARKKAADQVTDKELAKQVKALRKPNAAAWAVNALARERPELVEEVLDLGEQLRDAQADADGSRTRLLDRARRDLTSQALGEASSLTEASGGTLSAQAAAGVEETLRAAMTDPDAGEAVQDGLLVTSFAASPFEPVDLTHVLAVPPDGSRKRPARRSPKAAKKTPEQAKDAKVPKVAPERELDRRRRAHAEAAVKETEKAVAGATEELESRTTQGESLRDELKDLKERAAAIEKHIAGTERAIRVADRDTDKAERALASAKRAMDKAETQLDRLDH
jgi:hypothetical protein